MLNALERAILRTVLYADVFNFPMTPPEIAHFLIADTPYTLSEIERTLAASKPLNKALEQGDGYIFCTGRAELVNIRRAREQASQRLWGLAARYGVLFGCLPFVRMVALTGALSMRNAAAHEDDIDYVIVTAPRRVWLARLFAVFVVRIVKLRGIVLCPNYVLAETALAQSNHSLYIAHEVAQMIPIVGRNVYDRMRAMNAWVYDSLPNASHPYFGEAERSISTGAQFIKHLLEVLLSGKAGDLLERWEHRRKVKQFASALQIPHSDARLDAEHVKGHFDDHGHPVMIQYRERLRRYQLDEHETSVLPMAGD